MKYLLSFFFITLFHSSTIAQSSVTPLSISAFNTNHQLSLSQLDGWEIWQHNTPPTASDFSTQNHWEKLQFTQLSTYFSNNNATLNVWLRINIKPDSSFYNFPIGIARQLWAASDIYLDGKLIASFGKTSDPFEFYYPLFQPSTPIQLPPNIEQLLVVHIITIENWFTTRDIRMTPVNLVNFLTLTSERYDSYVKSLFKTSVVFGTIWLTVSLTLLFLFLLFYYLNPDQFIFKLVTILSIILLVESLSNSAQYFFDLNYQLYKIYHVAAAVIGPLLLVYTLLIGEWILKQKNSIITILILILFPISSFLAHLFDISLPYGIINFFMIFYFFSIIYSSRKVITWKQLTVIAGMLIPILSAAVYVFLHKFFPLVYQQTEKHIFSFMILGAPFMLLVYISIRFKEILKETTDHAHALVKLSEEKKELLSNQNIKLEQLVSIKTSELQQSLDDLKTTQSQLIQSEKMASLGELTAGIAHEIQNPLNFVNNFSEINNELITELLAEIENANYDDVKLIANDIRTNEEKINHHGKRADAIVKGMLQHSRTSSGIKEPTNINSLADEYLRLAYHGIRAKDKTFNAIFKTEFDSTIDVVNVVPQDLGRVILNLITNAFYAVNEKKKSATHSDYEPTIIVSTKKDKNKIIISVTDNGKGIPPHIKEKIFQPFFTTKPTGEGTGLGLSLSYDIIKSHGGEISVESTTDIGTTIIVSLPT